MLPLLVNSVKQGLDDPVDDVRAVAATSLLPVTDKLISLLPQEVEIRSIFIASTPCDD